MKKYGPEFFEKFAHLLGVMPDAQIAKELGCSIATVSHRRKVLGIASVGVGRPKAGPKMAGADGPNA